MSFVRRNLLALSLALLGAAAQAQTTVESFSPQGVVKGVRQVHARFSGQMVPFGDLRLADPFQVDCPQAGAGRWVDGTNWSYDFERDLPAGLVCRFELKPGLRDLAGQPVQGTRSFSFSSGGPAVIEAIPRDGSWGLDENQIFILGLDAPARDESIERHAYCRAAGVNEKIGVRLIGGKRRDEILAQRKSFVDRHLRLYFKARGWVWSADLKLRNQRIGKLPIVLLQCARTLPPDANVSLVWGAGISTESGVPTTEDQTLAHHTRPDFSAKFSCSRTNAKGACIPFLPLTLNFTAPVKRADAKAIRLVGAGGKAYQPTLSKEDAKAEHVESVSFSGGLPAQSEFKLTLPDDLKDDAGRPLLNRARFPLTVRTSELPPLAKFPARFGIIEAKGDRSLPVTLRNLEPGVATRMTEVGTPDVHGALLQVEQQDRDILAWLKRLRIASSEGWVSEPDQIRQSVFDKKAATRKFKLPKPNGRRAFEVVGIPLKKPGFYVVELESPKLGAAITQAGGPAYIQSAALVTNLAAHFKHGAESSLVWVTTLDRAQPVAGALVAVRDCNGGLIWQGSTDGSGLARIAQPLPLEKCRLYQPTYFISARSGGDMTFTLSDWDRGIEKWRFNLPQGDFEAGNLIAATVFDRTLLRAGETVHMKHFVRRHAGSGIRLADDLAGLGKLELLHQGSDQKYELPLKWSRDGSAENTWQIPADAKQGVYVAMIGRQRAGSFRVEAFRVPTMKALLVGPKAPAVQASQLELDIQLNYLSGGGASNAPVKLRTVIQNKSIWFRDYDEFNFGGGDLKEGIVKDTQTYDEDVRADESDDAADPEAGAAASAGNPVRTRSLTLDARGAARVALDRLPQLQAPRDLLAELEYRDANGETLTASTRIPLWSSKVLVGLKPDSWVASKSAFQFQALVLDLEGKPAADAPVAVDFYQRLNYSHRRRLIGGFYAYDNINEVKRIGPACEGKTDAHGLLTCKVKAPADGNLILRAKAADADGRAAYASQDVWIAGGDEWWFNASDNDRIDVLPEKKQVQPGETATLQVRMPFREATALVTIEREGILDTAIVPLSGKQPVVQVPIKGSYAPNVYVSVLVVRGRVAGVKPTALVDLGKPAFKMGIAPLKVGWSAHELNVAVSADKEVYRTREKARVRIAVRRPDGSAPPAGAEVALAAVDVGLLELMPNDSWNLLEAMMQQRALQVTSATSQMQVVGKRHFGRKAVPHGGGGGNAASVRELFDTLLFWKARVALDANGEATVEVPLNDSLTSFRIVAVAHAGAGLFGTGRTDIRSTQDLILVSGLPALVREGDSLRAGFTVRNTSAAALSVTLEATVAADGKPLKLAPQTVTVAPGQAQEAGWDFRVPFGAHTLQWDVVGSAGGSGDKLRVKQVVGAATPLRIYQATLLQLEQPLGMSVQMPADAVPGRGGVQAVLSPRLGGDLPGVRDYMSRYPYTCLEQNASKAVALRDAALWKRTMAALPAYLDGDGLVKYFPMMRYGSDTLTAYVISIAAEAGYEIPAASLQRMEKGLIDFVQGRVIRHSELASADVAIRKMAALEALSRGAKVKPELLDSIELAPNLWPTSAVIDWYLVLQRTSTLPERAARLEQAAQILKSRLNFQGTTMGFSTERKDDLWWLMISPDVNANRILLAMLDNPQWKADIGRLARGTLGRQHKGRWNTTVANAWGVLAIEKFSQAFESQPVTGSTSVSLDRDTKTLDWSRNAQGGTLFQPWPPRREELSVRHSGGGKPWATIQSVAAIPLKAPLSSGFKAVRSVTPVEQKTPGAWSRGDVARVRLELEAQSDMTWVVVDDPVPSGASILGTGLGRDSKILSSGEKREGWVWPAFEERTLEAFRAYYEFVPKGKWVVEYSVRLNNPGQFELPPTRIEAMYAPEMFGEVPNAAVTVGP